YLMIYTAGRSWIEMMRIDDAHTVLGLRLNVWTSLVVFAVGLALYLVAGRLGRPREVVCVGQPAEDAGATTSDIEESEDTQLPEEASMRDGAGVENRCEADSEAERECP
ncbi:MAG: prolipoprotein diacylglyceryl transferase, partial [Actinomyces bouchesdurhonensis]|nr:prolipoprotein diacylglyceryl transferase [Actinomyces bouchesdurhonensis]